MTAHNNKQNGDDDTTREAEALGFDYTGEFATGSIAHDERGQARWKFKTESTPAASDPERTFDLLKALSNDALRVESAPSADADQPTRHSGYNPYDVTGPGKSKPKPKPRDK